MAAHHSKGFLSEPVPIDADLAGLRQRHELLQVVSSTIAGLVTGGSLRESLPLAMEKIAAAVSVDRMLIVEVQRRHGQPPVNVPYYVWKTDTAPPLQDPRSILAKDAAEHAALVEWRKPLQNGESVFASRRTGPANLSEFLSRLSLSSILLVPIVIEGRHWGQIGFDDCSNERDWTEAEISTLKLLADVIGVTITRERYVAELANANTIIQNSPNILFRLRGEPTFPLIYVSQNVTSFGYDPLEFISTPTLYQRYVHAEDLPRVRAALLKYLHGDTQPATLEFRMVNSSGESRWVENRYTPVRDGDRLVEVEGILADVTERKRAEQRMATGERLESIGRLAAGVAHEINTPIQFLNDSVSFISEAVQDLLADNEKLRTAMPVAPALDENIEELKRELPPALTRIGDGLGRIAEIVRSMKDFSHADQREKSQVDLNRAIGSTLVIARSEYKYVADVKTDFFKELPLITCHGGQINQVVLNLVVNAAHAIADRVKGTTDKGLITVRTRVEDGCAVVSISDTGGGIPEAIRKRIFEPFFTTKEVGKGTGQGLSIAHNVVTSHGGTLEFITALGVGTTFHVRLPLLAQDNEA